MASPSDQFQHAQWKEYVALFIVQSRDLTRLISVVRLGFRKILGSSNPIRVLLQSYWDERSHPLTLIKPLTSPYNPILEQYGLQIKGPS